MKYPNLVKSLENIANYLDKSGQFKSADVVTQAMIIIAEAKEPLPEKEGKFVKIVNEMQALINKLYHTERGLPMMEMVQYSSNTLRSYVSAMKESAPDDNARGLVDKLDELVEWEIKKAIEILKENSHLPFGSEERKKVDVSSQLTKWFFVNSLSILERFTNTPTSFRMNTVGV